MADPRWLTNMRIQCKFGNYYPTMKSKLKPVKFVEEKMEDIFPIHIHLIRKFQVISKFVISVYYVLSEEINHLLIYSFESTNTC
jgi:hypothetical protein